MEFSDIDPSHFLDQLSWDDRDNGENNEDDNQRSRGTMEKVNEFSCSTGNNKQEQGSDTRGTHSCDLLPGIDDGSRVETEGKNKPTGVIGNHISQSNGDSAALEEQNYHNQDRDIPSFPPMASYKSIMATSTQSHQQAQPHLLTHPLAMTSMSSCPSFPLHSPSHMSISATANTNVASRNADNDTSTSNSHEEKDYSNHASTFLPQSSTVSQVTSSNLTSSQTASSQTRAGNNDPSISSSSNNFLFSNQHQLLPSWNDSMGDLMYSPLLNMGIPSTAATNNDSTSINSFQCMPLNNIFGSNFHQSSGINHHYGMAINGFHPQVNATVNHVLPLNNSTVPARAGTTSPGTVKTSNAGKSTSGNAPLSVYNQKQQMPQPQPPLVPYTWLGKPEQNQQKQRDKKASNERNEREQMRAKKITQLIHDIRSRMVAEGWKEEMKSKYETLSQCKAYMEYLAKCHKEKEIDIEHTKRLIEEKALLEGRSDPESIHDSVTSSLTASSRRSTSPEENGSDKESSSSSDNDRGEKEQQNRKKRKTTTYAESINAPTSAEVSSKNSRSSREKDKEFSSESSSEEDAGNEGEGPGGKNISFDKASSSVSDMTDSNRSSTNGAGTNKKKPGQPQSQGSTATSSISSTAAVMRGSSQKSPQSHRHHLSPRLGAVTKGASDSHKKSHKKKRRSFDYNYREVFLKSNIPQLIVTLSGRIVVWNEFFLLCTGLTKREAKSLSIFSIVESSQLTELYRFVAKALADNKLPVPASATPTIVPKTDCEQSSEADCNTDTTKSSDAESWQAITLQCISFASKKNKEVQTHPNPLYITITLMLDTDRDKRCFHCMITDCPGTNGVLGSVTPELLSVLFTPNKKCKNKEGTN